MKKIFLLLLIVLSLGSCVTTSLSTKKVNYYIIKANARGFDKHNNVTSYDSVIKIGKLYYVAILNSDLKIIEIKEKTDGENN